MRLTARPASPAPTGARFVAPVSGLRGLAILTVVLYHTAGGVDYTPGSRVLRGLYESGFMGIDVLFFITGFVLFLPVVLDGSLGSIRAFAVRRWARLGPAYYLCLVVVAAMLPLLSSPRLRTFIHLGPQYFLAHATFLQWELVPHDTGFIVDLPVWTLSIDACFYVLLPLIAGVYRRRPFAGLLAALLISQLWRTAFMQPGLPQAEQSKLVWLVQLPLFLRDFAAGMTAAWVFVTVRHRGTAPRRPGMWALALLASVAGLLLLAYLAGTHLPYHLGAYQEPAIIAAAFPLCLLAFTVALALGPGRLQWPLTNRLTMWFTEISYSVYLYHYAVIFFAIFTLHVAMNHRFPTVMGLVTLPVTLVIATISCRLIERPGRALGRRISQRLVSVSPAERLAESAGAKR